MQRGLAEEPWTDDAWGFGGVDLEARFSGLCRVSALLLRPSSISLSLLQSLQAELAKAKLQKEALLQQALHAPIALEICDESVEPRVHGNTAAGTLQPFQGGSLPPKAPVSSSRASSVSSKQPPVRSLSWGSSTVSHVKQPQLLRRTTSCASQGLNQPIKSLQQMQQQQLLQQQQLQQSSGTQQAVIERWLSQEHTPQLSTASDVGVDSEAVRQEVLQEVLQAMTLNSSTASNVDFNSLSVKASQACAFLRTWHLDISQTHCLLPHCHNVKLYHITHVAEMPPAYASLCPIAGAFQARLCEKVVRARPSVHANTVCCACRLW